MGVGLGEGEGVGNAVGNPGAVGAGVEPVGKIVGMPLGSGDGDGNGEGAATLRMTGTMELTPVACAPTVTTPRLTPLYEMPTVEPGKLMVVACSRKAPLVSEFVIVIGTEYWPGPVITLPSASLAVTLTTPLLAIPGVNVPLTFTAIDATFPLTVKVRVNGVPGVTVAVVVALPRTLPAPLAASYSVSVKAGEPAGALSGIVQLRPPLALVQRDDAGERSMTTFARPLTVKTPDTTDGETKCGLRADAA